MDDINQNKTNVVMVTSDAIRQNYLYPKTVSGCETKKIYKDGII